MLRGDRLRELREERGVTREELAIALELSANQVYRYETGVNDATGKILYKLARFFDVSTDYLLGLSDERQCHPKRVLEIDMTEFWEEIEKNSKTFFAEFLAEAIRNDESGELAKAIKELKSPDSPDS